MPFVFAAVTPHPPFLIPAIGQDAAARLEKTRAAFQRLEEELYIARPQVIIVVTPHSSYHPDAFVANADTEFNSRFDAFGDLTTKKTWRGTPDLAARLAHQGPTRSTPVRLVSEPNLDYGASVPLFFLTTHLPDCRILPVGFSHATPKEHLHFGELIKEIAQESNQRIALIASGDLSHTLTADAPGGLKAEGTQFDQTIQELLVARNTVGITNISPELIAKADQCGYRSILIALGALKNQDYTFKPYAYEAPFGIGYLTGAFSF